jgi:hypothetical protein
MVRACAGIKPSWERYSFHKILRALKANGSETKAIIIRKDTSKKPTRKTTAMKENSIIRP